ncbi:MAG: Swt1 family HEPN domain-containing protein [Candidatus Rokuibacteriota bacterium]
MTPVTQTDAIKLFGITNQLIEHSLDRAEREYAIDLKRDHHAVDVDEAYYPQIESAIRTEAASMAPHYEVFYSLETTIRRSVREQMHGAHGEHWWDSKVPQNLKAEAKRRQEGEAAKGFTPRSVDPLDFLTFGELGEIIKSNWDDFGAVFASKKAVERVMADLNTIRGPIAHCSPLAEDEVVRLRLAVRDWFRLGE